MNTTDWFVFILVIMMHHFLSVVIPLVLHIFEGYLDWHV
jgi:hypothetical protein